MSKINRDAQTASATGVNPSGKTDPIWYRGDVAPSEGPVIDNKSCDVCVIGAGISGLTTAYLLAKAGRSVIVVDEKPVAGGETGRTSAHLASEIDDRYVEIERTHGLGGSITQYESHSTAIDKIEEIAKAENIDCNFRRLDAYLMLAPGHTEKELDEELEAAHRAGFTTAQKLSEASAKGIVTGPVLRFPNQGAFDPLRYLLGVSHALIRMGVRMYTGTRVMSVTGGTQVKVETQAGHTITAQAAVAATNVPTPINNWAGIYTKIAPYRTYMVGLELPKGIVTDALYWDVLDPYHYARLVLAADGEANDVLIVGGEDHKTGQHTSADEQSERFGKLEAWTREMFPRAGKLVSRWTGQVNEPDDYVAFIGKVPTSGMENVYVITGDSGMGMTHGTLGAMLVTDLITGKPNDWAKLYDPARKPTRSITEFVKENVNAAVQYTDYVTPGEVKSPDEIQPGEGAIVRRGLSKVAVYKDAQGTVHECSAVCTHLKGIVHWNSLEKSWDCPVHGSRFDACGKVLTGPAIDDLPQEAPKAE